MTNLYFIRCQKFVKIGIAVDVPARLVQLQTGNPHALTVLAVQQDVAETLEGRMHTAFLEDHHNGEWFRFSRTLRKIVLLIRAGARPETAADIEQLRQFAPKQGHTVGNIEGELCKGPFDSAPLKVIGLRSRSA
jgi:hypothetical protein